jgi:hypothetical protein
MGILRMKLFILEETMKHQWCVRRELKPYPDGQQRWDRAYQYLLRWTLNSVPMERPSSTILDPLLEVQHENCSVRTGLDLPSNADPDHRTAA